jgi:hypothetical protein
MFLSLSHMELGADSARSIAQALRQPQALPGVTCLDMGGNGDVGDEGMATLADALKSADACRELSFLNLGNIGMGPVGAAALAAALAETGALPHLRELEISSNRRVGDEGIIALARALRDSAACPGLAVLSLKFVGVEIAGLEALCRLNPAEELQAWREQVTTDRLKQYEYLTGWTRHDKEIKVRNQKVRVVFHEDVYEHHWETFTATKEQWEASRFSCFMCWRRRAGVGLELGRLFVISAIDRRRKPHETWFCSRLFARR